MNQVPQGEYVVTLATLNEGAALELFDTELKKLLDNIADVNTDPELKRDITLKVVFEPDEDRKRATVSVKVTSKLAGSKGVATNVWFGVVDGQRAAVATNPNQGRLFDKPGGRVIPISGSKELTTGKDGSND